MIPVLSAALYGCFGGVVRGLAGIVKKTGGFKSLLNGGKKKLLDEFRPQVFAVSVALSGCVAVITNYGYDVPLIAGIIKPILGELTPFALILAGFTGIDLLETVFKKK